ncbi:hypothetical protein ACHAXA_005822 [Cyclostephanos tholiformis]|uniref:Uncharacterized protein n=1 Tax=Cyclostephanos tholiformis TaxID=382380 RepID=A0ABD3RZX6_9STRA
MSLAPPAPPMATSFSGLYNDASKDPFRVDGSYDDFLAPFNINAAGGAHDTPETVRNRLAAAANQRLPVALALLVEGRLRPYFLPFRQEQAMGAPPHPATDGKLFAYDGELVSGQGPLAEIPNSCFNLSPVVVAPTTTSIATQLAADPHLQLARPYAAADGMGPTCLPLTTFCQIAFTRSAPGGNSHLQIVEPAVPGRHVPLLTQAMEMLHHLPALAARGANAKDRLGIFQGKVANEFLAMGATYKKYTPNLYLLTELTSLRWPMLNPDVLDSGALGSAFLFTDSNVESEQNISRQIGIISSGGAAPSLADAQQLLKMKINLPGPDDSIRAVRRLHAVCRAVLPVAHPLTNFLGQHYAAMRSFDPGWQTYATSHDQNLPVVFAPDPNAIIDNILEQKHGPTAQPAATPGAPAEAASRNASRAGGSGTRVENTHFNKTLDLSHKLRQIQGPPNEVFCRGICALSRMDELVDMIHKGHWIVLPYSSVRDLPGLRVSPPGVVPQPPPHPLDDLAESIPPVEPLPPTGQYNIPSIPRDPALPRPAGQLSYVDVFVDDFVGLAQDDPHSSSNRRRVRRILLHAVDDVFRPLEPGDPPEQQEPVSLNKLRKGDCSWATIQLVLGWIIDTTTLTIHLPSHRVARLAEILASIPRTQRCTSLTKWHTVLGELRSMSLALPAWRFQWLQDIVNKVVTDANPHGSITNSDLELAGGLLHLDALAHCFDIRERTILSKGDNLSTTFWERKEDWMSTLDADTANRFGSDIRVAQDTVLQGVSPGRAAGIATAWGKWIEFTHDLGLDPFLQTFQDKIPFLQVFAQQVHSGNLAANGNPIKSRSVEDYIQGVAQTFLHVGAKDPRLNTAHTIDFRLQRTLKAWKTTDPASLRVKPIPIAVIKRIAVHVAAPDTPIARVFNSVQSVTLATITSCIREAVAFLGPDLGFLPSDVSARCLRAAGATALLLAQVDPDVIRLIGRWRSDEMLRYLHMQAYPLMRDYARCMLSSADYTLIPNHLVPQR